MVQKYDSRLRKMEAFYSPKEFRALGYRERWEVRVSDGIWITPEKLVETTMSKREVRANPGVFEEAEVWLRGLVDCVPPLARVSESGRSFALTGDAVRDWHRRRGFEVGVKLTDKNLPARFYGGLTEVEGFGLAPLRPVANLSVRVSVGLKEDFVRALLGVGTVFIGRDGRLVVRSGAPEPALGIMRGVLEARGVDASVRVSYPLYRREVCDVPVEFFEGTVTLWTTFVKSMLVPSLRETVNLLLGRGVEEQDSYYAGLVAEAFGKFSEAGGVPFGGYLASSLPNWVNDLPRQTIGSPLANFQANRKRAIRELQVEGGFGEGHWFGDGELAERMGLGVEEYRQLKDAHENWKKVRMSEELSWRENGQERVSYHLDPAAGSRRDLGVAADLLLALLEAGVETGDVESCELCLGALAVAEDASQKFLELRGVPERFKVVLMGKFSERRRVSLAEE